MPLMIKCALVPVLLVLLASTSAENNDSWSAIPSLMDKVYDSCERKDYDLVDCLKIKVVSLLDRVAKSDVIELDKDRSLQLVREGSRADYSRALTEADVEETINAGRNPGQEKGSILNQMIFDRVSKFLSTHSLKLNLPRWNLTALTGDSGEGRGKMKKTMGMFMTAAMMKAMMMIPMSIGTLFILAGKALIISKIALVLSLIVLMKKLLSKPTEHVVHESHGWNPSGGSGGWDKRSYRQPEPSYSPYSPYNQNVQAAQNLAYNSYVNH